MKAHWTLKSGAALVLATLLAGHTAEELIFNEVSTGPHSDIEQATKLARKMVTDYGMSETLGPRTFGNKEELVFLLKCRALMLGLRL